jgi:hypothetical protein
MVLAYSHSEWFVPSLGTLTDPERQPPRVCMWHNSRRAPKSKGAHLVKCSIPIGSQDAEEASHLVEALRNVPEGGQEFLDHLRQISSLLLCKRVHRSENAQTIYNFWVEELRTRVPSTNATSLRQSPPIRNPSVNRRTSSDVILELGISIGSTFRCHGQTKTAAQCTNWISRKNGDRISAISRELAEDWRHSSKLLELLEELSGLIMCRRYHQDQARVKLNEWEKIVESMSAPDESPQAHNAPPPRTPTRESRILSRVPATVDKAETAETPETISSSVWTSPRQLWSPMSNVTTPSSGLDTPSTPESLPASDRSIRREIGRQREDLNTSPTPIARRTRSITERNLAGPSVPVETRAVFKPITTYKSPLQTAEYVMEKITAKISANEKAAGFVYGYRRSGCELIKIGTTTRTVAQRMSEIRRECRYESKVVFEIYTKHAMKVEKLVHRHLYSQNRHECLIDAACNGGKGCHKKHKEWFEGVSDDYAVSVAQAWVDWISLEPYDHEGVLKVEWVQQTKLFELRASGDIWMRWTKITAVKEEIKDEITEECISLAEIKKEEVIEITPGPSGEPQLPRYGLSVTVTEIIEDNHSVLARNSFPALEDVFA